MWKQCRNKSGKDQEGTSETVDQMVWLCVGWTRREGGKGRAQKRSKVKVQKQNSEEEVEEKESETDDGGET